MVDPTSYEALLDRYQYPSADTCPFFWTKRRRCPTNSRTLCGVAQLRLRCVQSVRAGVGGCAGWAGSNSNGMRRGRSDFYAVSPGAFTPQETAGCTASPAGGGTQRPIYTELALKRLHQTSNGNARRVNRIAALYLLSAALTSRIS